MVVRRRLKVRQGSAQHDQYLLSTMSALGKRTSGAIAGVYFMDFDEDQPGAHRSKSAIAGCPQWVENTLDQAAEERRCLTLSATLIAENREKW